MIIAKIAFEISKVADRKAEQNKTRIAAKLYRLATRIVRHDMGLMKELLKRREEEND